MAPKARTKSPPSDPNGMFSGMLVFLIESGVQARRLQIWKQKLVQMGAKIEDHLSKTVTHVFAMDSSSISQQIDSNSMARSKSKVLNYLWLEDCLKKGEKVPEDPYILSAETRGLTEEIHGKHISERHLSKEEESPSKKIKPSPDNSKTLRSEETDNISGNALDCPPKSDAASGSSRSSRSVSPDISSPDLSGQRKDVTASDVSLLYKPPDLNRNVTEIFGQLIDIYRALGEDRRSFSYYKAIPVIEKLPFKIENADQVKHLPGIGKSLHDHIQEIVNTGKLAKLEHFKRDEKTRTISLFGEVWGIGPATALKLYEKGHRTLDDLRNDDSLSSSQRLGLKYFDDIKTRIPRHEVQEMESLLQKVGEEILPGVGILNAALTSLH